MSIIRKSARAVGLLGLVGLVLSMACSSEGRTGYFTFLLQEVPISGDTVDVYLFIPWSAEPAEVTLEPCYLWGFDLRGRAVREIAGTRTTDSQDQPEPFPGSYAQYLADKDGMLIQSSCVSDLDARFGFGGAIYTFYGHLSKTFADPGSITITPGEQAWAIGMWSLEGGTASGPAGFWPYEVGASASANSIRVFPTEPGR